jgi:hypothetical protein
VQISRGLNKKRDSVHFILPDSIDMDRRIVIGRPDPDLASD